MKNILIVGAGNIGFWHLQGILLSKLNAKFFIFDKKKSQLIKFKNKLNYFNKNITLTSSLDLVPKEIDFITLLNDCLSKLPCSKSATNQSKS